MKDFIAFWLVAQLVFIGAAAGTITYEIDEGTHTCDNETRISEENSQLWFTIKSALIMPLAFFVSADLDDRVNEYCESHELIERGRRWEGTLENEPVGSVALGGLSLGDKVESTRSILSMS